MIIKRLRMENIRSYREVEVDFPGGKTLFEGDIGSGKSTILMAIEFALFGLGSAKAASLLRIGESRGSVELEFEANGKNYAVRRVLARKGGSIQQVEGKLRRVDGGGEKGEEEEEEEDYPATEMKERILSILNFREPTDPKSRSLIYQYAIYTPQEEMKTILTRNASERLSILRRAFGVEEYKIAMENARELARRIHDKKYEFESASRDVPNLRKELEELERRVVKGEEELAVLERSELEDEKSLRQLESEREELHTLEVQLASASRDREHLRREIKACRDEIEGTEEQIGVLERKGEGLSASADRLGDPPGEKSADELKSAIAAIRKEIEKHRTTDAEIGTRIRQFESVAENGKCPVCERDASPAEFAEKVETLSREIKVNSVHLGQLNVELGLLDDALERRREYDVLLTKAKGDLARAAEYRDESEKKRKALASLRDNLVGDERGLAELQTRIEVLGAETKRLEPLRRRIESTQRALQATREKAAGMRSDVRKWKEDAKKRSESITRKEKLAAKTTELSDREMWLEEYFIPTVESIETHVLASINREFGYSFQRWFSILVEDGGKEVRVDEDFTPLVDQEGYDQDIEFLSGGERTSVALAYRLALSQMVQKFAEVGPSSLILDEPTDGFSKEQLGKVREILDEIANPQVVIVSHERELESMADQIYRVAKVGNESKITS